MRGGFIARITIDYKSIALATELRWHTARKRPLQDRLPQALGAFEAGFDGGFEFFGDGEAAVDFIKDCTLF